LTPLFLRLPIPDAANLRIAHEDVYTGGAPLQEQVIAVGDRSSILSPWALPSEQVIATAEGNADEGLALNVHGPVMAAAIAVCTLNNEAEFEEVVHLVGWIEADLGLKTAGIVAMLSIGQPLLIAWTDWKLALFISASFAVKMLYDEAFHLGDVPFPRDKYRLKDLVELERCVFAEGCVHLHTLEARLSKFRGALTEVLLAETQLLPFVAQPRQRGHVLVVEDDENVQAAHAEMLREVNPNLVVAVCDDARTATNLARKAAAEGAPFDLVLLDLVLKPATVSQSPLLGVYAQQPSVLRPGAASGFDFASEFRDEERSNSAVSDYEFGKALVVLVTSAAPLGAHRAACKMHGVDVVMSKPLQLTALNAISSFCWNGR